MSEQAFLQAIIAKPDDDALRLIFADWLDERGDPRAPFIRIQCQLARLSHDDPHEAALRAEEGRLSRPAIDAFVRSVPETLRPYYTAYTQGGPVLYQRGLLASVWVEPPDTLEHFIHHAQELFQFAPIQNVRVQSMLEDWGDQHRSPSFAPTPLEKVRDFLQVPSLAHVRDLEMHCPFEDIDAVGRLLAECPYLGKLARLFLNRDFLCGHPFQLTKQTLLPSTQELLRTRFGTRVSW
jgi:uncharacterized protein (TIGR02996 family)